ncbi:hypothetical protein EMEDMD4_150043 [Sinorhizobium medicae]|uniref:Uncharacterized protein n=1 Tax=Sinorhizobium medicae TaxID=110321 RepID=A0A508WSF7_9HYPH|nr:hypothetical protein EMEDMD4_150043 [Sinorhizobium medicae]
MPRPAFVYSELRIIDPSAQRETCRCRRRNLINLVFHRANMIAVRRFGLKIQERTIR